MAGGGNYPYVGNILDIPDLGTLGNYKTPIQGPLGTYVKFKIACSVSLNTSNYLFETLGGNQQTTFEVIGDDDSSISDTVRYIDSTVRITGATTGYSINVPVRFIKLASEQLFNKEGKNGNDL